MTVFDIMFRFLGLWGRLESCQWDYHPRRICFRAHIWCHLRNKSMFPHVTKMCSFWICPNKWLLLNHDRIWYPMSRTYDLIRAPRTFHPIIYWYVVLQLGPLCHFVDFSRRQKKERQHPESNAGHVQIWFIGHAQTNVEVSKPQFTSKLAWLLQYGQKSG
jgi:hypothetical protein